MAGGEENAIISVANRYSIMAALSANNHRKSAYLWRQAVSVRILAYLKSWRIYENNQKICGKWHHLAVPYQQWQPAKPCGGWPMAAVAGSPSWRQLWL
jgi:hypothetical protein